MCSTLTVNDSLHSKVIDYMKYYSFKPGRLHQSMLETVFLSSLILSLCQMLTAELLTQKYSEDKRVNYKKAKTKSSYATTSICLLLCNCTYERQGTRNYSETKSTPLSSLTRNVFTPPSGHGESIHRHPTHPATTTTTLLLPSSFTDSVQWERKRNILTLVWFAR